MPGFSLATGLLVGSLATSAVGTGMAVRSARKQGQAGQAAANAEADLSEYNAAVAELQAADAVERGIVEANRYRQQVRGIIGAQRASFAGQGVDVASGTPAAIQVDTAALGELDALQLESNAKREAWGLRVEAYDSKMRAYYARQEGVMLRKAGNAAGTAALVQGVGGMLSSGLNYTTARYGFATPRTTNVIPGTGIPVTR